MSLRIALLICLVASLPVAAGPNEAEARVDAMLEALGGRDLWASARSVFTMERARYPVYGDGIVATHWIDLQQPGEKVRLSGERLDIEWAWDAGGGWIRRDDEVRDFDEEEMRERRAGWSTDLFRLLGALARRDEKFAIEAVAPKGVLLEEKSGEPLAELHLTFDGELYRWKKFGARTVTMIFGSHRRFGEVNFPDWGTLDNGDWSAYFTQVYVSPKEFSRNVSLKKPAAEWQGGALHADNCEP